MTSQVGEASHLRPKWSHEQIMPIKEESGNKVIERIIKLIKSSSMTIISFVTCTRFYLDLNLIGHSNWWVINDLDNFRDI